MASKLTAQTRYIAYLDILGFKDMLGDKEFRDKATLLIEALEERIEFDQRKHPYLSYLAISDTIIITAEKGKAPELCWKVAQVQNALLTIGFCVRGGIAFGELLVYESKSRRNIFGVPLADAYSIELERSIYPRVVIDDDILADFIADFSPDNRTTTDLFIVRDTDGLSFVNQFGRDLLNFSSNKPKAKDKARRNKELYSKLIANGLKNKNKKARMKRHWLRGQLDLQYRNVV